jgi:hypothetical protein
MANKIVKPRLVGKRARQPDAADDRDQTEGDLVELRVAAERGRRGPVIPDRRSPSLIPRETLKNRR